MTNRTEMSLSDGQRCVCMRDNLLIPENGMKRCFDVPSIEIQFIFVFIELNISNANAM